MDQECIHLVHFFLRDAVRGHEINGVAEGAEVDAGVERPHGNVCADGIGVAVSTGVELEGQDGTQ